jgi:Recombinase/Resolvase, N terminal domain
MSEGALGPMPNWAAAYVRVSTEHQQYSTKNQMDVIREYAKQRGLEIVQVYSEEGKVESEIAAGLNARGLMRDFGRAWTRGTVHEVLTNEKYIGNNVYHRRSFKLKRKHVRNPPDKWVRADGAFEGIVEAENFFRVREIILAKSRRLSDEELLEKLRAVLKEHGRISGIIIDEGEGLPSSPSLRVN